MKPWLRLVLWAKRCLFVGFLAALPCVRAASASESPSGARTASKGDLHLFALAASTLVYRPPDGGFQGPQKDITAAAGIGYFLSDTVVLELGLGPTLVTGKYKSFGLLPAVLWKFHRVFYVGGRLIVPVDPEVDVILLPLFGVTHALGLGLSPFFEIGVKSAVGRGDPDFGVVHSVGLTYLL